MKIEDFDYVYCLGNKGKEGCDGCKRNVLLYENKHERLFWLDMTKITKSTAKRCPEFRTMKKEKVT